VIERLLERDVIVGTSDRPGKSRARRRERAIAERGQRTGAADVPRIGNDEDAGCVKFVKGAAPIGCVSHVSFRAMIVYGAVVNPQRRYTRNARSFELCAYSRNSSASAALAIVAR
jgi:hypothetical protein